MGIFTNIFVITTIGDTLNYARKLARISFQTYVNIFSFYFSLNDVEPMAPNIKKVKQSEPIRYPVKATQSVQSSSQLQADPIVEVSILETFSLSSTNETVNSSTEELMEIDENESIDDSFENTEDDTLGEEDSVIDLTLDDEETEFLKVVEILKEKAARDPYSKFFTDLKNDFSSELVDYAKQMFIKVLSNRFEKNVSFAVLKSIFTDSFDWQLQSPNTSPEMAALIDRVKTFANSNHLQQVFVRQMHTFIEPENLIVNETYIGQIVRLKKLALLALSNVSIVQSIIDEQKLVGQPVDGKYERYDSELTCDPQRRQRLLGKLRIEIGYDDFSLTNRSRTKHKYFAAYMQFTNIPAKHRLKLNDTFLLVMANRKLMKKGNVSINQLLEPVFEDLKFLDETGIDISYKTLNGNEQVLNIKGVLSALVSDNLSVNELIGLKCAWDIGSICRKCAMPHNDYQIKNYELRPLLASTANIAEYNTVVDQVKSRVRGALDNRFGINRECIFTKLPGVTIWNIAPPDPCHDVAEGVVERILTTFILRCGINLNRNEIIDTIANFDFYNGSIKIYYNSPERTFAFSGTKAVQV